MREKRIIEKKEIQEEKAERGGEEEKRRKGCGSENRE